MDFSPSSQCAHCIGQITLCTVSLYSVNNSVTWITAKTFFAGLTVALISSSRTCLSQVPFACAWPATTGPKYPSRVNEAPSAQSCGTYCCQVGWGKKTSYTYFGSASLCWWSASECDGSQAWQTLQQGCIIDVMLKDDTTYSSTWQTSFRNQFE